MEYMDETMHKKESSAWTRVTSTAVTTQLLGILGTVPQQKTPICLHILHPSLLPSSKKWMYGAYRKRHHTQCPFQNIHNLKQPQCWHMLLETENEQQQQQQQQQQQVEVEVEVEVEVQVVVDYY